VDSINLRIASGSYCCLLGPSGCGKSTTLRMMAGHESVTSGDILLENRNITDLPAAGRGTAMMFQSFALFPHLSALDNVAFSLKMKGVDKAKRAASKPKTCWTAWPWATWPSASRPSSRAASSSAWRWHAR
jgi:putative spermidine/putrescine transport system ATP-binding protein